MKPNNVVMVTEAIPRAGTVLMWTLVGTTNLECLTTAWVAEGLPEEQLPAPISHATALRRAANALRAKHRLIRPLGRGEGFAVVLEHPADDDLTYEVGMKLRLDRVGRLAVEGGTQEDRDGLVADFHEHLATLTTEDMSAWLVRMVPALDGVSLRGTGGVYFVPFDRLAQLDAVVRVLKASTTHAVYRIPAMAGDDAVAAILDAVEAEAVAEVGAMQRELEEAQFGARGYENRIGRTDRIEQKVCRYEGLLGARIDGLRARLEMLRAQLTVAMVKAQGGEDDGHGSLAAL